MNVDILYNYYFLQKSVYPFASKTGLNRLFHKYLKSKGVIIMLHRVIEDHNTDIHFASNQQWIIKRNVLIQLIEFFKKGNYVFISMDEVLPFLESKNNRPFVVFTLDDGYKDNLEVAYPVFKKYNVPFTIYISPGLINKESILWEYLIEDLLLTQSSISFNNQAIDLKAMNISEKEILFKQVIDFFNPFSGSLAIGNIKTFFFANNYDYNTVIDSMLLNWNEINDLNVDKLCTIGSHSYNHYCLRNLFDEESKFEVIHSKIYIESKIGGSINHFAYPYGRKEYFSKRELSYLDDAGYTTAVTSSYGNIYQEQKLTPFMLPRLYISNAITSKELLIQIEGVQSFIFNNFQKIFTL